ncbi:hypothetical protein GDO81_006634 [Engystomops pustulosus]|uniref:Methyltransferase type 11 domain-containing protein n=1 Tax=Engystomops pustulosus TaxID=76066 RepID=A0AAV7CY77_ENGPU|nr:hypothetical protein GDO81_006634 [Engystomops pustulosus]
MIDPDDYADNYPSHFLCWIVLHEYTAQFSDHFTSGLFADKYDAVIIVGALSDGQVPVSLLPELLRVSKAGGLVCMTTRSNTSNLKYKADLEEEMSSLQSKGFWEQVLVEEVEQWEKATSEKEIAKESDYISGVIYIYRKIPDPSTGS